MKRKEKRKGKEKETCSRASTEQSRAHPQEDNLFIAGYQRTTCTLFNLLREYQLLTYSLDFSVTKLGSMRLVVIYPLWGEGEEVG